MTARILYTRNLNPHDNLALENAMLDRCSEPILLLWQNRHTVVIGRNQNAWRECDTALLKSENGTLARRTTGGGAVYHDMGNLNFSFLMPIGMYNLERQLSCILGAVQKCGIEATFSGRNDIVTDGRKFSGNAFKFTKSTGLHHGTLLVNSDFSVMSRYLNVSLEKMEAKGVASVPARVINLSERAPGITVLDMRNAMCETFARTYGCATEASEPSPDDLPTEESRTVFASWEWNYGKTPAFDVTLSKKLDFGEITIGLSVNKGIVSEARVYTDAMDAELADKLSEWILYCPVDGLSAKTAELASPESAAICEWLNEIGY